LERNYRHFDLFRGSLWADPNVHCWYKQNIFLFVSQERKDLVESIQVKAEASHIMELPMDIVHPEKFEDIASYREIFFKRLLQQLPRQILAKVVNFQRQKQLQ
jgi:hypothetical protein